MYNRSKEDKYPPNQQAYTGSLIPRDSNFLLSSNNITVSCENCEEFQEDRDCNNLRVISCINCSKEYTYCFCNEICHKATPGTITKNNYEYLTCDKKVCDYLGVRCTECRKLCKILVSNEEYRLIWCCKIGKNQCHYFKQHVLVSISNHIDSSIVCIDVDVLCRLILRYVDNLEFIDILKKLYKAGKLDDKDLNEIKINLNEISPQIVNAIENVILKVNSPTTPNRIISQRGILKQQEFSPIALTDTDANLVEFNQASKNEMQKYFKIIESNLSKQNDSNFSNLENELKRKFDEFEADLKQKTEEKLNELGKVIQELKVQTQNNNESLLVNLVEVLSQKFKENFTELFKRLKLEKE